MGKIFPTAKVTYPLDDYSGSPDILIYQIIDSDAINDIWDDPLDLFNIKMDYSPQALAFAHEVMPMFADIIRKEINGEHQTSCSLCNGTENVAVHKTGKLVCCKCLGIKMESMNAKKGSTAMEAPKEISQPQCTIDTTKVEPLVDQEWAESLLENLRNEG